MTLYYMKQIKLEIIKLYIIFFAEICTLTSHLPCRHITTNCLHRNPATTYLLFASTGALLPYVSNSLSLKPCRHMQSSCFPRVRVSLDQHSIYGNTWRYEVNIEFESERDYALHLPTAGIFS